mgnify:CR=1 FL=1
MKIINNFRLKQRQEDENKRYQDNMHKKMDMLLKLKSDIQANRVSLNVKMPSYRGVAVFSLP